MSISTATTLAGVRAWVIDVDGCLVRTTRPGGAGGVAMPRAGELLAHLRGAGHDVVVCTNASQRPPRVYAAHLREIGIDLADEDFVTAGSAAADHVAAHHPGARLLVVGDEGISEPALGRGLTLVDADDAGLADVVVVGAASSYPAPLINAACLAVDAGAALYTTVDVPWFHGGLGRSVTVSATMAHAIGWPAGVEPEVVGKPSAYLGEALARRLGAEPHEIAVVGDATIEIRLARAMGATSVLVLSGAIGADEVPGLSGPQAPVVVDDVAALLDLLRPPPPTPDRP